LEFAGKTAILAVQDLVRWPRALSVSAAGIFDEFDAIGNAATNSVSELEWK